MNITVKVKSLRSNRFKVGVVTPRELLGFIDEVDLINKITACECQPIGETNVIDCNCDEEWDECEIWIGDEIKACKENEEVTR